MPEGPQWLSKPARTAEPPVVVRAVLPVWLLSTLNARQASQEACYVLLLIRHLRLIWNPGPHS